MQASLAISLAIISTCLSHWAVRYATGGKRKFLAVMALATFAIACVFGPVFGGFWAGFYTLVAVYFLVAMVTPWMDLAWQRRNA